VNCPVCQKPVEPVAVALTFKIVGPQATEALPRRYRDGGCVRFQGLDLG